jgi:hypothetical protein
MSRIRFLILPAALLGSSGLLWPAHALAQGQLPDLTDYRVRIPFDDPFLRVQAPAIPIPSGYEYPLNKPQLRIQIDSAISRQTEQFRNAANTTAELAGFRIQIYSGNNAGAQQARSQFMTAYPTLDVYTLYERPLFKVRVGNYLSEKEAEKFCKELKIKFPSAFVVPETVQITR